MIRNKKYVVPFAVCILLLLGIPAQADLIAPSVTHIYFEKDGIPWNKTVHYSVNCYGSTFSYPQGPKPAGTYRPELVFHYSATCEEYGCPVYQPYYLQYTHIDWCDLEGETEDRSFFLGNFSAKPYSRCDIVPERIMRDTGNGQEYYFETPEYQSCRIYEKNTSMSWKMDRLDFSDSTVTNNTTVVLQIPDLNTLYGNMPFQRITLNKSDLPPSLSQYIRYLETCDPVTDSKCGGWTIDGKPLKSFTERRTLKNNITHLQDYPCDTFLVKADPSLIMPITTKEPWHHVCVYECNYTMNICESRFAIPSGEIDETHVTVLSRTAASETLSSAGVLDTPLPGQPVTSGEDPAVREPKTRKAASVGSLPIRSPVESLYCSILNLFGAAC